MGGPRFTGLPKPLPTLLQPPSMGATSAEPLSLAEPFWTCPLARAHMTSYRATPAVDNSCYIPAGWDALGSPPIVGAHL